METKQRTFRRILSPSVQPIGQALCRGNWQSIALAVTKCDEVWSLVITHVLKVVAQECTRLCKKDGSSSLFRKSAQQDLKEFSWESLANELRKEAPTFFQFLVSVAAPTRQRNTVRGVDLSSRFPAICTSGAILLKERNSMMSAVQQLIGVILFHGDIHKTVSGNYQIDHAYHFIYVMCFIGSHKAKSNGINCSPKCYIEKNGSFG